MCLWRCRSSVASLVIATVWWIARAPLALACWLAPLAPSRVSRVARRHDGDELLHSRVIRGCISACASGAVDLWSLRSSSRRRGELFARLSRSHVDSRLTRRLASLALLVVMAVIFVAFSSRSRRVHLAPSSLFGRFARHHDSVVDFSRVSRARVSARASCAVACLPRCSSSRRRLLATSRQCPWHRRPPAVASLVIATARWIARAPLALACQLAPPASSRISRVARRRNGEDPLHSRVTCGCIPACASCAVIFACVALYHDDVPYHSRVTRACVSLARASRTVSLPSR